MFLCIIAIVFRTLKVFVVEPILYDSPSTARDPTKTQWMESLERLINEVPTEGASCPGIDE